jgi:hypothetical protein
MKTWPGIEVRERIVYEIRPERQLGDEYRSGRKLLVILALATAAWTPIIALALLLT